MPEQRCFTLFDVLFESFFLLGITTGCYLGWQVKESFFSLYLGGAVGYVICRIFGVMFYLWLRNPTPSN